MLCSRCCVVDVDLVDVDGVDVDLVDDGEEKY